jgi:sulfur carrier protein ThiS
MGDRLTAWKKGAHRMKLHLGGSLAWYDKNKRDNLEITVNESISLNALLRQLSIPRGEVAIVSINGELFTGEDILVRDTDTIMLFPPISGGAV